MMQDFPKSGLVDVAIQLVPYLLILLAYLGYRRWRKRRNRTGQPDGR